MKEDVDKLDKVMKEIKCLTHSYLKEIYNHNISLKNENIKLKQQLQFYIDKYGELEK